MVAAFPSCLLLVLACLSVLSEATVLEISNNSTNLHLRRNLQATPSRESKKIRNKQGRASKLLEIIEKTPIPSHFVSTPESAQHNPLGPAVFTSAMDTSYSK